LVSGFILIIFAYLGLYSGGWDRSQLYSIISTDISLMQRQNVLNCRYNGTKKPQPIDGKRLNVGEKNWLRRQCIATG
jgi:hypothetical protein